jgi:mono/diheme cytochrome c family protein
VTRGIAGLLLVILPLVPGCSWDGTWHVPTPSLERMLEQPRYDSYEASSFFANGMAMRLPPEGTVAFRSLVEHPVPELDRALLMRGQTQFEIFCAPCHGVDGMATTPVAQDMVVRPPPSLHEPRIRALPDQYIYGVITEGYGLMPTYADRIVPEDRWAVIAYVRALQLSREVPADWLPPDYQRALREESGR